MNKEWLSKSFVGYKTSYNKAAFWEAVTKFVVWLRCRMEQNKDRIPEQLQFLADCIRAISDQRYRDTLEIAINGLVEAIETPESVDSKALITLLIMALEELELTLKKAFGTAWEDRIAIPEIPEEENKIRCSFCGKAQEEVHKIIAGPTVYICNECIAICNEILSEER